jgi:SAM-dependent methyltransferase
MDYMWDVKFNREEYLYGKFPNSFISERSKEFTERSRVICYGEGEGRNAIFLAKNGFEVTALDPSSVGLEKAKKLADANSVKIETVEAFVEDFRVENYFDYAVSSFMHVPTILRERVFNQILKSLKVDGVFTGEFFSKNQLKYSSGGPKDLDLLYSQREMKKLLNSLENCELLECNEVERELNEGVGHIGEASLLQVVFKRK